MRSSFTGAVAVLMVLAGSINAQSSSGSSVAATTTPSASDVVSSIPASIPSDTRTASSNFTLPVPAATATLPANFVMQSSTPFIFTDVDTDNLPTINYSLLNETQAQREIICAQQTKFCSTAGCADEDAKIKDNVCNVDTMGVMCTCTKGSSNLQQWKWPVQFQDCLRRGTTCANACALPGGTTQSRNDCKTACQASFGGTCGFPNQYAANYAVSKANQKPSFSMIQGGSAGNGATSVGVASASVIAMAGISMLVLLA